MRAADWPHPAMPTDIATTTLRIEEALDIARLTLIGALPGSSDQIATGLARTEIPANAGFVGLCHQ
jgi:hypothetical protein